MVQNVTNQSYWAGLEGVACLKWEELIVEYVCNMRILLKFLRNITE